MRKKKAPELTGHDVKAILKLYPQVKEVIFEISNDDFTNAEFDQTGFAPDYVSLGDMVEPAQKCAIWATVAFLYKKYARGLCSLNPTWEEIVEAYNDGECYHAWSDMQGRAEGPFRVDWDIVRDRVRWDGRKPMDILSDLRDPEQNYLPVMDEEFWSNIPEEFHPKK